eukprot:Skav221386  [mRNA]  locus=scaffold4031:23535:23816:+ [translate_table: standard]
MGPPPDGHKTSSVEGVAPASLPGLQDVHAPRKMTWCLGDSWVMGDSQLNSDGHRDRPNLRTARRRQKALQWSLMAPDLQQTAAEANASLASSL